MFISRYKPGESSADRLVRMHRQRYMLCRACVGLFALLFSWGGLQLLWLSWQGDLHPGLLVNGRPADPTEQLQAALVSTGVGLGLALVWLIFLRKPIRRSPHP